MVGWHVDITAEFSVELLRCKQTSGEELPNENLKNLRLKFQFAFIIMIKLPQYGFSVLLPLLVYLKMGFVEVVGNT